MWWLFCIIHTQPKPIPQSHRVGKMTLADVAEYVNRWADSEYFVWLLLFKLVSWRFKPVRLHYITAPLHSAVAAYTMFWPTQTSEMMGIVLPSCPTWALTLLIISPLHTAADWPKVNPEMSLFCLLTSFHAVVTFGAVCGIETPTSGDGWNHTGVGGVAVDPAGLSVARLQWGAAVHWMGDSWGLRTSAGEQFGSFAASWA